MRRTAALFAGLLVAACATSRQEEPPAPRVDPAPSPSPTVAVPEPEEPVQRLAPPAVAYAHGWMPLGSTGADRFVQTHPTWDGRGVLIAILDTGVDPGAHGLQTTSAGEPKLIDVRDFSGEGAIPLARVTPRGDTVVIAGKKLGGFGRVVGLDAAGPYYAGMLRERTLGEPPAADLNADGDATDTLALVVAKATDGWVVLADTDGDGSLAGERPTHDFLTARESFGWSRRGRTPRVNLAANFSERAGVPALSLVFALDAHGTHVAGIAAGHDLYGVSGFDGVAPGARLLGLKISNGANGSVSTSGAIVEAMDYAIRFAAARRIPLVLNLSFGVGNEVEGEAVIDRLVDSVLAAHPDVVLTVAAGNDGPGLSTVGFPGSSRRGITVGGIVPATFLPPGPDADDAGPVADFSARGGELARPDLLAPALAYSSVPLWNAGDEIKQGTSMAAPHAAGLAALLLSAAGQERRSVDARTLRQALMVTARPVPGGGYLDEGRGLADVSEAYRWLSAGIKTSDIVVQVAKRPTSAAWIVADRSVEASGEQEFELRRPLGEAPATFSLRSDVPWLTAPAKVTLSGETTLVKVRYAGKDLAPGAHTGVVSGWPSDTMAGPGFRLVTTVVVPTARADSAFALWSATPISSGNTAHAFFQADSTRPFEVRASGQTGQEGAVYLHEPGGAPFREGGAQPIGAESGPGSFRVDARDVVPGLYQVVGSPAPGGRLTLSAEVVPAPVTIGLTALDGVASARLQNPTPAAVSAEVELRLRGGQRQDSVAATGSQVRSIPFDIPAWATGLEVDIAMDRAQWGRFTDFGVTVSDTAGVQVAQDPLEYSFGRLSTLLPEGHGGIAAQLSLAPGFADAADTASWTVHATIRLYADSAVGVPARGAASTTLPVGGRTTVDFPLPPSPWPLPEGFAPLGVILVRTGDQVWTREGGLGERSTR